MNSKQEAKLYMSRSVEQQIDAITTTIAAMPAFMPASNKAFNAQIIALAGGQEAPRTGVAADTGNKCLIPYLNQDEFNKAWGEFCKNTGQLIAEKNGINFRLCSQSRSK